jgi:hypothetical protein
MGFGGVVRKEVAKHEATLFGCMGMKVYVDIEVLDKIGIMQDGFLHSPDCWLVEL